MSQPGSTSSARGSFIHAISPSNQKTTQWSIQLVLIVFSMICSATFLIIGFTIQGKNYGYNHGVMQTAQMFVGEYLNLILFFFLNLSTKSFNKMAQGLKEHKEVEKTTFEYSILWMGASSFLDSVGSGLGIAALLLIPASVNMMLTGGQIVTTCITSRILFKRLIHRHHVLGCVFTSCGFIVVGISSIIGAEGGTHEGSKSGTFIGIGMILVAICVTSIQQNLQEWIFRNFELPVQREIGFEGKITSLTTC